MCLAVGADSFELRSSGDVKRLEQMIQNGRRQLRKESPKAKVVGLYALIADVTSKRFSVGERRDLPIGNLRSWISRHYMGTTKRVF